MHRARVQGLLSRRGCRFFFNRTTELDGLEKLTSGTGKLILVTGPQDSGKSALMKAFEDKMKQKHEGHVIPINMRHGRFDTAARFAAELKSRSSSFLAAAKEAVKSVETPEVGVPHVDAILAAGKAVLNGVASVEKVDSGDLMSLLKELESLLHSWQRYREKVWRGAAAGFPTIIIDEANKLRQWSLSTDEQQNLAALQEFFIMLTKETGRANVILCTSEDYFRVWLSRRVGYERFHPAVVGDISKEEARTFFIGELKRSRNMQCRRHDAIGNYDIPDDLWEDIYGYLGGRMLLLKDTAEILSWDLDDMKPGWKEYRDMFKLRSRSEVLAAYDLAALPAKWSRPVLGVRTGSQAEGQVDAHLLPRWTADEYTLILKKMAEAQGGVVSLSQLMKDVDRQAVFSLVQHNFLHCRDVGVWAKDLLWYKGEWPVVMPRSMPRFWATKEIVNGM